MALPPLLLATPRCSAIVSADKALLFEPGSSNTRKLLDTLVPRLQASAGQRLAAKQAAKQAAAAAAAAELDDPVGYRDSSSGSAASGMARQADAKCVAALYACDVAPPQHDFRCWNPMYMLYVYVVCMHSIQM